MVPEVRFKGFSDDWEQHSFQNTLIIHSGKDYKHLNKGNIPVYGTGGYMLSVDEKLSKVDGIGLGRKGTIDKPQYLKAPFWTVDTLFYMTPKPNFEILFLYAIVQKYNWKKLNEASGVPSLSKKTIEKVIQFYPVQLEQKKLGILLKTITEAVLLQQRQLDSYNKLKKGLLQKLFPKDREKLPEMRFAYFTGDWEQVKLSDLTKFHKQGFYTTESYNESKKYYLLRGTDLTGNKLAVHDDTPKINASEKEFNDFKVEVGDVLLVRSGGVGTYGIVYDEVQGIFGSYLIDFRFDQTQMLNEFFGYFYESDLFKQQLRRISQKSANLNINAENIKSISIDLPSIEEQKKIESILKQIDSLITLQQEKMNELEALKKYLLQKLFI